MSANGSCAIIISLFDQRKAFCLFKVGVYSLPSCLLGALAYAISSRIVKSMSDEDTLKGCCRKSLRCGVRMNWPRLIVFCSAAGFMLIGALVFVAMGAYWLLAGMFIGTLQWGYAGFKLKLEVRTLAPVVTRTPTQHPLVFLNVQSLELLFVLVPRTADVLL